MSSLTAGIPIFNLLVFLLILRNGGFSENSKLNWDFVSMELVLDVLKIILLCILDEPLFGRLIIEVREMWISSFETFKMIRSLLLEIISVPTLALYLEHTRSSQQLVPLFISDDIKPNLLTWSSLHSWIQSISWLGRKSLHWLHWGFQGKPQCMPGLRLPSKYKCLLASTFHIYLEELYFLQRISHVLLLFQPVAISVEQFDSKYSDCRRLSLNCIW